MQNDSQHLIDRFRTACKPLSVFETTATFTELALQELCDTTRPPSERYSAAIRLICCIPVITDRLTDAAINDIFSKPGIDL
jgi:hypothetical protein